MGHFNTWNMSGKFRYGAHQPVIQYQPLALKMRLYPGNFANQITPCDNCAS